MTKFLQADGTWVNVTAAAAGQSSSPAWEHHWGQRERGRTSVLGFLRDFLQSIPQELTLQRNISSPFTRIYSILNLLVAFFLQDGLVLSFGDKTKLNLKLPDLT